MTAERRPYLHADDRRRQLLDAAARVFARGGYAGLTMVALAAEAGVSRRLVYDHFPDLAALYQAFFDDRASRYLESIDRALEGAGTDALDRFTAAFAQLLTVPADDQRAVRLLVADPGIAELAGPRERFCTHVEARWLRMLPHTSDDRDRARARLWTLVSGLLGLAELVGRGEVTADGATAVATALVRGLSTPAAGAPAT